MQYYTLYSLTVASEIAFEEALAIAPPKKQPDITIQYGEPSLNVQTHPKTVFLQKDWFYCVHKREHVFYGVRGCLFEISNGNHVTVQVQNTNTAAYLLRTFLLGTVVSILLMQRGCIPIHGAAVVKEDAVSIIAGFSKVGKSAVLSVLLENGYRYLSDDMSVLSWKNGRPMMLPGYPQRKLSEDSALQLGVCTQDVFIAEEDGRNKLHIRTADEWCSEAKPLVNFVELLIEKNNTEKSFSAISKHISGQESLRVVTNNLYRLKLLRTIGFLPIQMKQLLDTVATVQVMQVARKETGYPIRDFSKEVEAQIQ